MGELEVAKQNFKKNGQGSYPGIYLTDQKLLDARF